MLYITFGSIRVTGGIFVVFANDFTGVNDSETLQNAINNRHADGIVDSAPPGQPNGCALLLGELDGAYGKNLPDSMRNIMISNVSSGGLHAINIAGYLTDSVITNVIYRGSSPDGIKYGRPGCAKSVSISNYIHGCYQNPTET